MGGQNVLELGDLPKPSQVRVTEQTATATTPWHGRTCCSAASARRFELSALPEHMIENDASPTIHKPCGVTRPNEMVSAPPYRVHSVQGRALTLRSFFILETTPGTLGGPSWAGAVANWRRPDAPAIRAPRESIVMWVGFACVQTISSKKGVRVLVVVA
jgi:hypothetical protein